MTEKTLIELTCSACEKEFHVVLVPRTDLLCSECSAFKSGMEHLMRDRVWEKDRAHRFSPALKGAGIGLLLMAGLLCACWLIVSAVRY